MKAIMISIHPQWVELILNFIKKDEIRKGTAIGKAITRLIKEQGVAPMLIYCTKKEYLYRTNKGYFSSKKPLTVGKGTEYTFAYSDEGKVVARFNATAEHIEYETCSRDISGWWKDDGKMYNHKDACLTYEQMFNYVGGGEGTVIHINNLKIFDKPKEISEFKQEYNYFAKNKNCSGCPRKNCDSGSCVVTKFITRAPQSFCFIEV